MTAYNRTIVILGFISLVGWLGFLCKQGALSTENAVTLAALVSPIVVNYVTIKGPSAKEKREV